MKILIPSSSGCIQSDKIGATLRRVPMSRHGWIFIGFLICFLSLAGSSFATGSPGNHLDFYPMKTMGERVPAEINGTVTDASGLPLIGVNIQVKGTTRGTVTDLEGAFTIE